MPPKKKIKKKKKPAKKKIIKKARRPVKKLKKAPIKKPVAGKKKAAPAKKPGKKEKILGIITHYFPKVRAGVIKLKAPLAVGDVIKIKGHTTDFTQAVASMQMDRVPINQAKRGQEIGILVNSRVRKHDAVRKA